jgi:MerR family redox-sensitive transcriptional activator SoxR
VEELSIGELAQRAGLRATAIRYYESVGLLTPARRAGGRRRYDEAAVERLAFIRAAQGLGFSLGEIGALIAQDAPALPLPERWQAMARAKLADVERLIGEAQLVRLSLIGGLGCACDTLDSCIDCVLERCAL